MQTYTIQSFFYLIKENLVNAHDRNDHQVKEIPTILSFLFQMIIFKLQNMLNIET
jgi:hypothetical protein